jgi:hypothetical protein
VPSLQLVTSDCHSTAWPIVSRARPARLWLA